MADIAYSLFTHRQEIRAYLRVPLSIAVAACLWLWVGWSWYLSIALGMVFWMFGPFLFEMALVGLMNRRSHVPD